MSTDNPNPNNGNEDDNESMSNLDFQNVIYESEKGDITCKVNNEISDIEYSKSIFTIKKFTSLECCDDDVKFNFECLYCNDTPKSKNRNTNQSSTKSKSKVQLAASSNQKNLFFNDDLVHEITYGIYILSKDKPNDDSNSGFNHSPLVK